MQAGPSIIRRRASTADIRGSVPLRSKHTTSEVATLKIASKLIKMLYTIIWYCSRRKHSDAARKVIEIVLANAQHQLHGEGHESKQPYGADTQRNGGARSLCRLHRRRAEVVAGPSDWCRP